MDGSSSSGHSQRTFQVLANFSEPCTSAPRAGSLASEVYRAAGSSILSGMKPKVYRRLRVGTGKQPPMLALSSSSRQRVTDDSSALVSPASVVRTSGWSFYKSRGPFPSSIANESWVILPFRSRPNLDRVDRLPLQTAP